MRLVALLCAALLLVSSMSASLHPFHSLALPSSAEWDEGFTTYLENLGRQSDGSLDPQLLALGSLQQLAADLLERGDLSAGEGDSDLVDFLSRVSQHWSRRLVAIVVSRMHAPCIVQ